MNQVGEVLLNPNFNIDYPSVLEGCNHFLHETTFISWKTISDYWYNGGELSPRLNTVFQLTQGKANPTYDHRLISSPAENFATEICQFIKGESTYKSVQQFTTKIVTHVANSFHDLKIGGLSILDILHKAPLAPKEYQDYPSPLAWPTFSHLSVYAASIMFDSPRVQKYLEEINADVLSEEACKLLYQKMKKINYFAVTNKIEEHADCKQYILTAPLKEAN